MSNLLIPFISAGFPQLESTTALIKILDKDADYIEIGLPHSDALADGPVIQHSSQIALDNGMHIEKLISQAKEVSNNIQSKLILFTYFNPLVAYGLEKALESWSAACGHSVLIPDLPTEEALETLELCKKYNLKLIFLIAPTSSKERIKRIVELSEEFIYIVSVTGVTGLDQKTNMDTQLSQIIEYIKELNPNMKTVIGFGIGDAEKAQSAIKLGTDGVVIGSAIIKILQQENHESKLREFMSNIKETIN